MRRREKEEKRKKPHQKIDCAPWPNLKTKITIGQLVGLNGPNNRRGKGREGKEAQGTKVMKKEKKNKPPSRVPLFIFR